MHSTIRCALSVSTVVIGCLGCIHLCYGYSFNLSHHHGTIGGITITLYYTIAVNIPSGSWKDMVEQYKCSYDLYKICIWYKSDRGDLQLSLHILSFCIVRLFGCDQGFIFIPPILFSYMAYPCSSDRLPGKTVLDDRPRPPGERGCAGSRWGTP